MSILRSKSRHRINTLRRTKSYLRSLPLCSCRTTTRMWVVMDSGSCAQGTWVFASRVKEIISWGSRHQWRAYWLTSTRAKGSVLGHLIKMHLITSKMLVFIKNLMNRRELAKNLHRLINSQRAEWDSARLTQDGEAEPNKGHPASRSLSHC